MSATIIPISGSKNGDRAASLSTPIQPTLRASLTGAARRLWSFVRRWVEGLGWLVIVASIIAAVKA